MPNGGLIDRRRWRIIIVLLGLITLLTMMELVTDYWVVPWPTPTVERTLTIRDEHWAAWMPIDNGFTEGFAHDYWNGVLIQLGRYVDSGSGVIAQFHHLVIHGSDGYKRLNRGEFTWINVVADRPGKQPPMSLDYIGLLYPDAGTTTECAMFDACADPYFGSGTACVCVDPPCEENELELIPAECMRLRSIHSHFVPEALITYWQGNKGYRLEAVQEALDHNKYEFFLNDPVTIEVYKGDTRVPVDVGEIRSIVIADPDDPDHDEVIDPGLDGGKIGS